MKKLFTILSLGIVLLGQAVGQTDGQLPAHLGIGRHTINPYMGNAHREVTDIQTFGNAPVLFTRYYNSRATTFSDDKTNFGTSSTWQHNWNWEIVKLTTTTNGIIDLDVRYPNGARHIYTASDSTGATRLPEANCGDRIYPVTGGFQLITIGDQLRYNFVADPAATGTYHLKTSRMAWASP